MHLRDHTACGFLKQTWDQRVHKSSAAGHQQTRRKPTRKAHMLKIGLINRLWVVDENAGESAGHGKSSNGDFVQNTSGEAKRCPNLAFQLLFFVENIPSMSNELDEIDRKLLALLQQDAALSVDAIADRVHLSRNACWRRIKRLEADGIVKKRVAIIDPSAVGLGLQVFVLIRTNDHSANWLKIFRKAVREMPEIIAAQRMTGELDYVLRVRVADVPAYDHFYQRLIDKVQIPDVSASFVMEDVKETTALPI